MVNLDGPEDDESLVSCAVCIWCGCQSYGPFLDPQYNTAPHIQGTPKGIISLTTTHMCVKR